MGPGETFRAAQGREANFQLRSAWSIETLQECSSWRP